MRVFPDAGFKEIMMKKRISLFAILALGVTIFVQTSLSAKNYGMAGCGLGSIVIGSKPGIVQIFAATTNGTSGNQTFGITSGTSNCTADGIVLKEKEQEIFVHLNFESLEKEMAVGSGEKLSAFANLLGCSKNLKEFSAFAKSKFEVLATDENRTSPTLFLSSLKTEMAKDEVLTLACGAKK